MNCCAGTRVGILGLSALIVVGVLAPAPTAAQVCDGDCNGDGQVRLDELLVGLRAALGLGPADACPAIDADGDGKVSVAEIVGAVTNVQQGCASFTALTDLPGWPASAMARALSADGGTLVGDDGERGVIWAAGRGTDLGTISVSLWTYPVAVSRFGARVIGQTNGGRSEGFVWQDGEIFQIGIRTYPTDISADGSVFAGYRPDGHGRNVAFRWAGGLLSNLGYLRPGSHTEAYAISADGSTVVGLAQYVIGENLVVDEAFRWRDGVIGGLGGLPGGHQFLSYAYDVSHDGSVVVGTALADDGYRAFRWENGVIIPLAVLPGYEGCTARAVTADGAVVFGACWRTLEKGDEVISIAFVWDQVQAMRPLAEVLAADFALDVEGWLLTGVSSIAADGRTLVGDGTNPAGVAAGWIARIGSRIH